MKNWTLRKRVDSWPVVLVNDDGIRPAGRQDQCFYCKRLVGEQHGYECVTVQKLNLYNVFVDGVLAGNIESHDPFHWDDEKCQSHKDNGSGCMDNYIEEIKWSHEPSRERLGEIPEDSCSCGIITLELIRTLDPGPIIKGKDK